jgi:hypothetical protein
MLAVEHAARVLVFAVEHAARVLVFAVEHAARVLEADARTREPRVPLSGSSLLQEHASRVCHGQVHR